jgi:hypothetical protein
MGGMPTPFIYISCRQFRLDRHKQLKRKGIRILARIVLRSSSSRLSRHRSTGSRNDFMFRQAKIALPLWIFGIAVFLGGEASAAVITQLDSETEFTSTSVLTDPFSGPLGSASEYSFDSSAFLVTSNDNQLARSGITFLADNTKPLTVDFTVDVFEVGAWMGNDDDDPFRFGSVFFGQVDFFLDAYDTGGELLGTVSVAGTGNDLIDQFVGLRSEVALGSVVFRNTSDFFNPGLALDDFAIGFDPASTAPGPTTPIPAPSSLILMITGLMVFAMLLCGGRPTDWRPRFSRVGL